MGKISEIVSDILKNYLPKIKAVGISFDLDFPDTTIAVDSVENIKKGIEKGLKISIKHSKKGCVKLTIKKDEVILSDTGLVIDKTTCKKLSTEHFVVKSRVGFGTTFTIK